MRPPWIHSLQLKQGSPNPILSTESTKRTLSARSLPSNIRTTMTTNRTQRQPRDTSLLQNIRSPELPLHLLLSEIRLVELLVLETRNPYLLIHFMVLPDSLHRLATLFRQSVVSSWRLSDSANSSCARPVIRPFYLSIPYLSMSIFAFFHPPRKPFTLHQCTNSTPLCTYYNTTCNR